MHVHISTSAGTAKFWLEPTISLADYYNLLTKELREIQQIVEEHKDEFTTAWQQHFGQ